MKIHEIIIFPCGYKYDVYISSGIFDFVFLKRDKELQICPLHNKKCKK